MGKKSAIAIVLLLGLFAAAFFLYSTFVGLERSSLAKKLPADTYASLSIRHLRKIGIAFATDKQLRATAQVAQALAKILGDAVPSFDFPGEKPEIDEEWLLTLATHFKTQLTIAALPPHPESRLPVEFALLTDFYGDSSAFQTTLYEIAKQASNTELGFKWSEQNWKDIPIHSLEITVSSVDSNLPQGELCWAIFDETLYLCSHADSLKSLLAHALQPESKSLADLLHPHEIEHHVQSPDVTFLLNSKPALEAYSKILKKRLIASGGLASAFNPDTFIEELGLKNIESFASAIEFTGDRISYSGVRYKQNIPTLSFLAPSTSTKPQRMDNTPIQANETINLNAGKTILSLKDAFLKAMPLANFPYFGIRSQIKRDSGLDIEEVLASSFSPWITSQHTLDFGTGRNAFGEIQEQIILDSAYKLKTAPNNELITLIESQTQRLLESNRVIAYQEDKTLFIDTDRDKTITSGRIALSFSNDYITIGHGTLKSFKQLRDRTEPATQLSSIEEPPPHQVGTGAVTTEKLPTTLFQLTSVLYQQVNNTKHIPQAFLEFDWSSLTILEQKRKAKTYHKAGEHLYRVSQQVD